VELERLVVGLSRKKHCVRYLPLGRFGNGVHRHDPVDLEDLRCLPDRVATWDYNA
jgi:hypothetical protein